MRAAVVTLIACLLLPAGALAQEPAADQRPHPAAAAAAASFDAVVLRPLEFAGLVIGTALFVPVAILTAPGGKDHLQTALDLFVVLPAKEVFQRPLGDF